MVFKGDRNINNKSVYKKELFKPWIFIPVLSKSGENWESYGRLKNSIWPTLSRHFEYLISFQDFYNCLNLSYLYNHTSGFQKMCSFVDNENGLLKIN